MFAHRAPGFAAVTGPSPRLVQVVSAPAHEGPVYAADEDALYATSVPRPGPDGPIVDILRLELDGERFPLGSERLEVLLPDANAANGMTLDREGRLVVCEQGSLNRPARIARVDRASRAVEPVVDAWGGRPLNSPNDVIVAGDGAIWFTDPTYGHLQGFRPAPALGDHVYRHDPDTGVTSVVADELDKPNGIALSPDERTLYVSDSGANQEPGSFHPERPHHVIAYDVRGGHLSGRRLLAVTSPGFPDGLKVDAGGRVYVSATSGVLVLSAGGDLLGEIGVPGAVNFCFGGPKGNVLFITADTGIWAAVLAARGPDPARGRLVGAAKGA